MKRDFVVLPQRPTRHEKRLNADLEFAREHWRREIVLKLVHSTWKERDPEMRWLAELFPLDVLVEGRIPTDVLDQRLAGWCAGHPGDARALAHRARVRNDESLVEMAVSMDDAWAMGFYVSRFPLDDDRKFRLACAAAELGSAMGTYVLADCVWRGFGCEKDEKFAFELLERAADLGSYTACHDLLKFDLDASRRVKLVSKFCGVRPFGFDRLELGLVELFQGYSRDGTGGDAVFEAGEVFRGNIDVGERRVFGHKRHPHQVEIFTRAVAMYEEWCHLAREACVAWVLIARRIDFNKDVRRIIAEMVWQARNEARGDVQKIVTSDIGTDRSRAMCFKPCCSGI